MRERHQEQVPCRLPSWRHSACKIVYSCIWLSAFGTRCMHARLGPARAAAAGTLGIKFTQNTEIMTVFNLVSNRALCDSDNLSPGYAGPHFQAPGITPFADDPHVGWCSAGATFPPRAWLFGHSPSNTQDWMMVGCPAPRLVMGGMTSTMS
jgi:hypothetical protein